MGLLVLYHNLTFIFVTKYFLNKEEKKFPLNSFFVTTWH